MQCVILAAGRGSRMKDATLDIPKPLISYKGKTLLEYKLEALPACIDEVIIVVGYFEEKIRALIGDTFNTNERKLNIKYAQQTDLNGTAAALQAAQPLLRANKPFMIIMGDDIYAKTDLEHLCVTSPTSWAMLYCLTPNSKIIYTGACVIDSRYFNTQPVGLSDDKEFGLPQTLVKASIDQSIHIQMVCTQNWKQMNTPEDIAQ